MEIWINHHLYHWQIHLIENDIENILALQKSLICTVLCDGWKLFGSITFWRLCGFPRSKKELWKHDCSLCNTNQPSPRQDAVKSHKAAMFTVVKYLQGTVKKGEVEGPEYRVFNLCVPLNYDFSVIYFQVIFV
jgi:hypothetical protein